MQTKKTKQPKKFLGVKVSVEAHEKVNQYAKKHHAKKSGNGYNVSAAVETAILKLKP